MNGSERPRGWAAWRGARGVRSLLLAAAPVVVFSACSGDHTFKSDDGAAIHMGHADSARILGPGDLRILTSDSAVQLALIGDTVFAGLGAKVIDNAKLDVDSDSSHGLGGTISRMVKSGVKAALGTQITYPMSAIRDARYENGRLMLIGTDGAELHLLQHSDVNGKPAMESFSPEDSRRFVAAIKKRKGAP